MSLLYGFKTSILSSYALKKLKENPKKSIAAIGLAALVATTAIKDNVHFGSVTLHNPQENHYTWGLMPTTTIKGDAKGNFYTIGLIVGANAVGDDSSITGNMSGYGLIFGGNEVGENFSITGDLSSKGIKIKFIIKKKIIGEIKAIMLPNKTAIPNKTIIKPRYIGFLVNLYRPSLTIIFGFSPGLTGAPNF